MYGNEAAKSQGEFSRGQGLQGVGMDRVLTDNIAKREPEIAAELNRLNSAVDNLGAVAERLVMRLEPMRRQTGATTGGVSSGAPEPVLCSMAAALRDRRQALDRTAHQLRAALDELEI